MAPLASKIRFRVDPADVPADKAARRLGLTPEEFCVRLPSLLQRRFPRPDPDTGNFHLEAIDRWLKVVPSAVKEFGLSPRKLTEEEILAGFGRIDAEAVKGSVYVIGFASYVKIGFTTNALEYRLSHLQVGAPEKLQVYACHPASLATERRLHQRFADVRLEGEWFRREGELAAWIDVGCPL